MKEEMTPQTFVLRPYTKAELAHRYLPKYTHRVAMRKFNYWLRYSPLLWDRLVATGLTIRNAELSYEQVRIIIGYLGEP